MSELIATLKHSILDSDLVGVATEMMESTIDSVLDTGLIKDIPIVNLVVGVGQVAFKIRDYVLLKQTMRFIAHLHDGSISSAQFQKYKQELEEDPKKADEELSRVIIILNRTIDELKPKILASFFQAYLKESISWVKFCELSEVLDRLFKEDIEMLFRISDHGNEVLYEEGGYIADRLISVGLVRNPMSRVQIPAAGGLPSFGIIPLSLTHLGSTFTTFYVL
jgi:hypothetical protein